MVLCEWKQNRKFYKWIQWKEYIYVYGVKINKIWFRKSRIRVFRTSIWCGMNAMQKGICAECCHAFTVGEGGHIFFHFLLCYMMMRIYRGNVKSGRGKLFFFVCLILLIVFYIFFVCMLKKNRFFVWSMAVFRSGVEVFIEGCGCVGVLTVKII